MSNNWNAISPERGFTPGDFDSRTGILQGQVSLGEVAPYVEPQDLVAFATHAVSFMRYGYKIDPNFQPETRGSASVLLIPEGEIAAADIEDIRLGRYKTKDGKVSSDGKHALKFGRLGHTANFDPQSLEDTKFAIGNKDVVINAEHVLLEDGIMIRLNDEITIPRTSRLAAPNNVADRSTLKIHGLSGTAHNSSTRDFKTTTDKFGPADTMKAVLNCQASYSIGPYAGVVQPETYARQADGSFKLLPWELATGSGLIMPNTVGQQLLQSKPVILNAGEKPLPEGVTKPSDIWIKLKTFGLPVVRSTESNRFRDWHSLPQSKKERLHQKGPDLVEVLKLTDPEVQKQLFDFSRLDDGQLYQALVVSSHGVTPVGTPPEEREFFGRKLIESVELKDMYRETPLAYANLTKQVDDLRRATPEGARVVVTEVMPDERLLTSLAEEGVRSIIFKRLSKDSPMLAPAPLIDTMQYFSREGMQFILLHDDDVWSFYGKQMVRHSLLERYEKATFRVLHFGTANEGMVKAHRAELDHALDFIYNFFGPEFKATMVSEDGGGPGNMEVTSLGARRNGVFTSGTAIAAEAIDQGGPRESDYDSYIQVPKVHIGSRQRDMENRRSLVIRHKGGIGTDLEEILSLLSDQLQEKNLMPIFSIDDPAVQAENRRRMADKCRPNAEGHSFARPWTEGIIVFCDSYAEFEQKFAEIMPNLEEFWNGLLSRGMSIEEFEAANNSDLNNVLETGLAGVSDFYAAQARSFIKKAKAARAHKLQLEQTS